MSSQDPWAGDTAWWLEAVSDDPIYDSDVLPLLAHVLGDPSGPWLDVGCGTGRSSGALPQPIVGCDGSMLLLRVAAQRLPVVRCRLPDLGWLRDGVLGGASTVLVLEHLDDLGATFSQLHRVVRPGGTFAAILNHPAFTAPSAGPMLDPADGEILWRWGDYFTPSTTKVPFGSMEVPFHHRPLGDLLSTAADRGWVLERCVERPLSAAAVRGEPGYAGQEQLPRLLGIRWRR